MKTQVNDSMIRDYQKDGFVMVEDFLGPDELHSLRAAVDDAVARMGNKKVAGGKVNWESGDSYYDKVFTQRLNLWKISPVVRDFMLHPGLGEMMCALAGVDGYRVWHDQALIKEPFGNPTAWHLDNPYWSFHSRDAISIWIALDDATLQNGCLYFIPGSHRLARFDNVGIGQNLGDLFKVYPEFARTQPVAAPMRAGSCSFHNGLCAHGAGANMTPGRRRAMTCAYMPEGATFNGQANILPPDYLATLKTGDTLGNDEENPVVFSRRTAGV